MIQRFLLPSKINECHASIGLLVIRVVFGGMLMIHGWGKLTNFTATAQQFAEMGGTTTAVLVIFAEFFCAAGVVVGLLYRLALIPIIINMGVAFFIAHKAVLTGQGSGEMALLYLAAFVGLFIIGSGKFAIDRFFAGKTA